MNWQTRFIVWFCGLWALGIILSQIAWGKSIDVTDGEAWSDEQIPVEIVVDDPSGIAGAAFTISYDSASLELLNVEISESFFDLMVQNPAVEEGMAIAAGRALPQTGTSPRPMFSLSFGLKPGAAPGDYSIRLIPTIVKDNNGWPPEGAPVDPLVGALFDVPVDEAFPVLLSASEPERMGEGLVRFNELLPSGPQTISFEVAAGANEWREVLTVPQGYRAKITHMYYVMDQAVDYRDYGAVFFRWKVPEGQPVNKHFANLWFHYKQPTNKELDLRINAGQTLEAYAYKKTSAKVPSVLSFTVEWEKIQ